MSDKRIVVTVDGAVLHVLRPMQKVREGESEADYHASVIERNRQHGVIPPDAEVTIVDKSETPPWTSDAREFRPAWTFDGSKFGHNVEKAKALHRDYLRRMREPELKKLDVEFMLALESGAPTAAVVAKKQALRDAPADPKIEAAKTVEDLRAAWPATLERPVIIIARPIK